MENNDLSTLAACARVSTASSIFSISSQLLSSLLSSFDLIEDQDLTTSFHLKQANLKIELLRDLQYLYNYVQEIKALKIYEEGIDEHNKRDLTKFKSLFHLEFHKVDVNSFEGLQKLRPQLQKIVCNRTLNTLEDLLIRCGGDKSESFCWNELKEVSFVNNDICEVDGSFEYVPWLHTLDLSRNQIKEIDALGCLQNLKLLNLSYNKLERLPSFKGQICSRLQNLILKNNFIEDIIGLQSLTNLWVLDLSNNCLMDHKLLLNLSHLATLQWLNLDGNPLSFHPHHRNKTASCLHSNTASIYFVLDYVALSKSEKKLIGSLHPILSQTISCLANDSISLTSDRVKKVRHVIIEEEEAIKPVEIPVLPPSLSRQHLETKRQIEDLHEQNGESWLNSQSGLLVQNILGLEAASIPFSSSPYEADFSIHCADFQLSTSPEAHSTDTGPVETAESATESEEDEDDPDIDSGEENIYLVTPKGETEPIFVVITKTHIVEKECSTSKQRARWHIKSVTNCEILSSPTVIQVNFETMRRDRKHRIYDFAQEDVEKFVTCIRDAIDSRQPKDDNVQYVCMKCSSQFSQMKNESVLGECAVTCPACDSTLIVEST